MKALIVVSFGTSVPNARIMIQNVESTLKESFPDRDFYRAFTSRIICKKLKSQGENISSMEELLLILKGKGYDDILVQPTHIISGYEYEKVLAAISEVKDDFCKIAVGKPLINSTEDLIAVTDIVAKAWMPDQGCLVLMGHGSSHSNNMIYSAAQTAALLKYNKKLFIGTVEGWPELKDVMEFLPRESVKEVTIAPFMLAAGDHALNDMAGDSEDSWKKQLESAGYKVNCILDGLGSIPAIWKMYIVKARQSLANKNHNL